MAAHVDAAAPVWSDCAMFCSVSKCLYGSSSCLSRLTTLENEYYSWQALLDIGKAKIHNILDTVQMEKIKERWILRQPVTTLDSTATPPLERRRRRQCKKMQNSGKRRGIQARLAANSIHFKSNKKLTLVEQQ